MSWSFRENVKTTQRLTMFEKSMKMEGGSPLLKKDCVIVIYDWERKEHKSLTASVFTKKHISVVKRANILIVKRKLNS